MGSVAETESAIRQIAYDRLADVRMGGFPPYTLERRAEYVQTVRNEAVAAHGDQAAMFAERAARHAWDSSNMETQ